ncbi:MAG: glycosyltransferase, partial [Deltaproteobacteria bacterium]|nr:glycosyltransferase [Deltaproteobacteria bacterium]
AFAVGGIPDMVNHGVNGFLARPHEPKDLACGLAELLDDTEKRQRMGEAGRAKVEREFAMPIIVKRHIALYEEVLEAGKQ